MLEFRARRRQTESRLAPVMLTRNVSSSANRYRRPPRLSDQRDKQHLAWQMYLCCVNIGQHDMHSDGDDSGLTR